MTFRSRTCLLLAASLSVVLAAGASFAQQPPTTPTPPQAPPSFAPATGLRGIPSKPIASTESELPTAKLKLPKGFKIELFASGMADARSLRIGDKGTVFVGNRLQDKVWAVVEKDGKRVTKVIAKGLDRPNGLAFKDGTLYVAEGTRISKLENIEDNLDNPPAPTVIYSDLPNHQSHGWKFIAI